MTNVLFRFALITTMVGGCVAGDFGNEVTGYVDNGEGIPSFVEFEEATFHEEGPDGVYIVNGDTPVANRKQLREMYDEIFSSKLIVSRTGGVDAVWSSSQKRNLSYCISNDFGSRKSAMVSAFREATQGWEQAADVKFVYNSSQDNNCTPSNNQVLFDVRPTQYAPYIARAFFPGQPRWSRTVIVDRSIWNSGFAPSAALAHELGHVLGFRHEHTRPEAGTCFEDNAWRPLTSYDSASIMHYPQCNGSSNTLAFSSKDYSGAAAVYGRPRSAPVEEPAGQGRARSENASGTLAKDQNVKFIALDVVPGSTFKVKMSGDGDADLYVRFGSLPSLSQYHCRPYLNGSQETCEMDVPSGKKTAHIMVNGYRASSFNIKVDWVEPR